MGSLEVCHNIININEIGEVAKLACYRPLCVCVLL